MSKPRKATPTKRKILNYWTSTTEGQNHIKRIRESYNVKIENVVLLDYDCYTCFACNKETSQLERCHIIPHANGGSSDVSNFVLMCPECHSKSPTINNEKFFWRWLDGVEDFSFWGTRINAIKAALPANLKTYDFGKADEVVETLNKYEVPVVMGGISNSTLSAVIQEVFENED